MIRFIVLATFVSSFVLMSVGFGLPVMAEEKPDAIATITTEQMQTIMAERDAKETEPKDDIVVVDCRSKEETAVSMIAGAITKESYEKNKAKYDGQPVIVYCLSGGRSGLFAKRLAGQGIDVKNYQGSIIAWVQAKQDLVTPAGEPTKRVHTYGNPFPMPSEYEAVGR